jgi:hypothetical protein
VGVRAGVESPGQRGIAGVEFPAFLAGLVFGQASAAGKQQSIQQRQRGGKDSKRLRQDLPPPGL